jgi:hypothetical protein
VIGFHTLVVGHVEQGDAAERMVMGLARLAIRGSWQGKGAGLLADAIARTFQAADSCGRFGFLPSPTDERRLYALIGDSRRMKG